MKKRGTSSQKETLQYHQILVLLPVTLKKLHDKRVWKKPPHIPLPQDLTILGAAADPEVQHLVFLGLCGLSGVIAQLHPQTSPRSCHLQK